MTEFDDIGAHCSLSSCNMKDFLPFTCKFCKKQFCLNHRNEESHNCISLNNNNIENKPLFCPICNQSLSIKKGENRNNILDEHIENGCKQNDSNIGKIKEDLNKGICSLQSCRNRELIPIICKLCKQQFCMKHRSELDHNCKTLNTKKSTKYNTIGNTSINNSSQECTSMCLIQ